MIQVTDYAIPEIGERTYEHHIGCPESQGEQDHKPRLWIQNDGNWVAYYCHHCGEKVNKPYRPSLFDVPIRKHVIMETDMDAQLGTLTPKIPGPELNWLFKHHLSKEDLDNYVVMYSTKLKRIVFPIAGGFVARSVTDKPKWLSIGKGEQRIIYGAPTNKTSIVLVEDIVSAIRVASAGYNVMALFGTSLHEQGKHLIVGDDEITGVMVWLDADATGKATKIYKDLSLYKDTQVIYTEQDPKEYTGIEIRDILK